MFCFVFIVAATWFIRTRYADAARGYAARLMRGRGEGGVCVCVYQCVLMGMTGWGCLSHVTYCVPVLLRAYTI
ncbi:hypothetical protein B0T26DRAFT_720106 [Lasiosphaeria miniovina]|uniref:Secreted protein n=1 Tax=Lasiosphaeria miniovina TaxID=1954250 RepID=A0AA40A4H9_9PEZI|nr:uncharacterized protein B0T26DRAFT_720106 [Lasiosphaeria miniovina]KAK0709003.1 hypothetical protein B0T26DRAFT_720106 [Lasiosphaeria miniovina]